MNKNKKQSMKYIKYKLGRGVYHISLCKGYDYDKLNLYGFNPPPDSDVCCCNGNWACEDEVTTDRPSGRLCARCKAIYLKDHTETELFLEMM